MAGRFVGYLQMKRYVLHIRAAKPGWRLVPAVQPREWLVTHTHIHTVLPLGKVSVPRASPRLVDYRLPIPQLSIRARSGPGNLGRRRASGGQQLAVELMGLSSGGFGGEKSGCLDY